VKTNSNQKDLPHFLKASLQKTNHQQISKYAFDDDNFSGRAGRRLPGHAAATKQLAPVVQQEEDHVGQEGWRAAPSPQEEVPVRGAFPATHSRAVAQKDSANHLQGEDPSARRGARGPPRARALARAGA